MPLISEIFRGPVEIDSERARVEILFFHLDLYLGIPSVPHPSANLHFLQAKSFKPLDAELKTEKGLIKDGSGNGLLTDR